MKEKALVTEVNQNEITVIPLITDACLSCTKGCAKQGKPFTVANPNNLAVKKGSIVKVAASKSSENIQGIFALLLPVVFAAAGFFAANPIASIFGKTAGEGTKALCVLSFLFISAAAVFFISRKFKFKGKPGIIEVLLLFGLVIALSSCSLNYGEGEEPESNNPEFIFKNAKFQRIEDKRLKVSLKAERLEQYKTDNAMFAQNIFFDSFDKDGKLETTGSCLLLDINNRDKIYYLFNQIVIKNIPQNIEINAQNLKWDNNSEQLTSGVMDSVVIKRDDLEISGKGFSASGVSRSFVFNDGVEGIIQTKDKKSEEESENPESSDGENK